MAPRTPPRPPDRRLGQRHEVPTVELRWRLRRVDTPRGQAISTHGALQGRLCDLSATGARIDAPAADDLEVGTSVLIELLGAKGPVTVRRITPGSAGDRRMYGVEFDDPTSELTALVHEELLQPFSQHSADDWHDARYVD